MKEKEAFIIVLSLVIGIIIVMFSFISSTFTIHAYINNTQSKKDFLCSKITVWDKEDDTLIPKCEYVYTKLGITPMAIRRPRFIPCYICYNDAIMTIIPENMTAEYDTLIKYHPGVKK